MVCTPIIERRRYGTDAWMNLVVGGWLKKVSRLTMSGFSSICLKICGQPTKGTSRLKTMSSFRSREEFSIGPNWKLSPRRWPRVAASWLVGVHHSAEELQRSAQVAPSSSMNYFSNTSLLAHQTLNHLAVCTPAGSFLGKENGNLSGVTRTPVVNLNGYFPPLANVNSTK